MDGHRRRFRAVRAGPRVADPHRPHSPTRRTLRNPVAEAHQGSRDLRYPRGRTPQEDGGGVELKLGHRQTEVGVIPEEWNIAALGDLVDQSRSIRYGIVQPGKYDPQGRFMIRGQDYSKGWVDPSDLFKVGSVVEERYRNARVKAKDLIITIVGAGTGYVESVPEWLDGANLTQTTARIAVDPAKADSSFCKFILQSSFGKNQVSAYVKGAAQPGLNCGDVEKFLLPLPPSLSEQRAIAGTLSDVDALIGALDQHIAKKRDLKQAAMQQLFTGQTRLPGFHGECEVKQLGAVFSISAGKSKSAYVASGGRYWVVAMGSVSRDGRVLVSKRTN